MAPGPQCAEKGLALLALPLFLKLLPRAQCVQPHPHRRRSRVQHHGKRHPHRAPRDQAARAEGGAARVGGEAHCAIRLPRPLGTHRQRRLGPGTRRHHCARPPACAMDGRIPLFPARPSPPHFSSLPFSSPLFLAQSPGAKAALEQDASRAEWPLTHQDLLTKGDNNYGDDKARERRVPSSFYSSFFFCRRRRGGASQFFWGGRRGCAGCRAQVLYAKGQDWLHRQHVMGRAVGYLPYVGMLTIIMNDYPYAKVGVVRVGLCRRNAGPAPGCPSSDSS